VLYFTPPPGIPDYGVEPPPDKLRELKETVENWSKCS